jgi:hypothetical protein
MGSSTEVRLSTVGVEFGPARSAEPILAWPLAPKRLAEIEMEQAGWAEITELIASLTPDERLVPGYFEEPPWSVRDLVGHLSAWQSEAREQLLDMSARSYRPHDIDINRRNAQILRDLDGLSWQAVWELATGTRAWMLEAWYGLREPDDGAAEWIRKAGAEHYAEHLPRLRAWVAELIDRRSRPIVDGRDP